MTPESWCWVLGAVLVCVLLVFSLRSASLSQPTTAAGSARDEIAASKCLVKQILPALCYKETGVTPCRSVSACVSKAPFQCLVAECKKISRGIGKLNFESASLLFVRDSSFHIRCNVPLYVIHHLYTQFPFNFFILSFPVVRNFFSLFFWTGYTYANRNMPII